MNPPYPDHNPDQNTPHPSPETNPQRPEATRAQRDAREYRHCRRCCLHDSRPTGSLIGALGGSGKNPAIRQRLLVALADAGEVA